jgi:WD40 repeat protein
VNPAPDDDYRTQTESRGPNAEPEQRRAELLELRRQQPGTPAALEAARQLRLLPSPFDRFRPEQIPAHERFDWQPKELVAIYGEHRQRMWGTVYAVALSPDGKRVAGGGEFDTIRVWDTATGYEHACRMGPVNDNVAALQFSPKGDLLAATHLAGSHVTLWDTTSWTERALLQGHALGVEGMAFAPDGGTLATASKDGTVKVWDVRRSLARLSLTAHKGGACCAAFSADGRTLATGGNDGVVKTWDVTTGGLRGVCPGHAGPVRAVAFVFDGHTLASVGDDLVLVRWDVDTRKPLDRRPLHPNPGTGNIGLAFAPDGQTLVWCRREEDVIHLTDVTTGETLGQLLNRRGCGSASFSSDGHTLVTGSHPVVRLWDVATRREKLALEGVDFPLQAVAVRPDDEQVALPGPGGIIELHDVARGIQASRLAGHAGHIQTLQFAPDGRILFSAALDFRARLWDLGAGQGPVSRQLMIDRAAITGGAFTPDGKTLATFSDGDSQVQLWEAATGARRGGLALREPCPCGGRLRLLNLSPAGRLLALGTVGERVLLWDMVSGREKPMLPGDTGFTTAVAFSPDGSTLASGSGHPGGRVRLWDLKTGRVRVTLPKSGAIYSLAYSPDGRLLVASNGAGKLLLYDAMTGDELQRWSFPGIVFQVVFSADSRHLVTANNNGTAYVLRLEAVGDEKRALQE